MRSKILKKNISLLLVLIFIVSTIPVETINADTSGEFNLTITEGVQSQGRKNLELDWDAYSFPNEDDTKYAIVRKNLSTGKWEYRGRYSTDIDVLNIYPNIDGSDGLQEWMENLSRQTEDVEINVEKVSIKDFNEAPEQYLYLENRNYNYDVVVFGFWDDNNKKDISVEGSDLIKNFIEAGGGVLYGHDTVTFSTDKNKTNFTKLVQSTMGMIVTPANQGTRTYSTLIKVENQGAVTTFPFDINDEDLEIPMSHTVNQLPVSEENIYFTFEKNYYPPEGGGPYYNYNQWNSNKSKETRVYNGKEYNITAYLIIDGNVAFVQCGHKSGKTNLSEQKVLANTIYALATMHFETNAIDQILDEHRPDKPEYIINGNEIVFNSMDYGTDYRYRIIAIPHGEPIPKLDEGLINALETESSYNNGRVAFSNSVDTSVEGELKEFKYIIDKSETYNSINSTASTLELDTELTSVPYKYFDYNEELTVQSNDYMHVIAVDVVNNYSDITTLNLWNEIPNVEAIVRFEDNIGNEIKSPNVTNQKYGTIFAPQIENINGYMYKESTPSNSIIVFDNYDNNVVTHKYEQTVPRDIYLVEHKTLDEPNIVIEHYYLQMTNIENEDVTLVVPDIQDYDFMGYYTVNSSNDPNEIQVSGNSITLPWTSEDLYVHYSKKTSEGKVEFTRSTDDKFLGEYIEEGYVSEILNMSGDSIKNAVTIKDLQAYENNQEVNKDRQILLSQDSSKNTLEVKMIPRTKKVIHYGIDYNISSKDTYLLQTEEVTYTSQSAIDVELKYNGDGVTDWKPLPISIGQQIDFTNPTLAVNVGYYKGLLPSESYEFKVDYINEVELDSIDTTYNSNSIYMGQKVEIPYKEVITKTNYSTTGRDVDFVAHTIEITRDLDGHTEVFEVGDDYSTFFPEYGYDDTYSIKVMYQPVANIAYKDKVVIEKSSGYEEIPGYGVEYLFKVPYDGERHDFESHYPIDEYEVIEVKINGNNLSNPSAFDFSIVSNDYNQNIEITYRKKTYDLVVNNISKAENISQSSNYYNIPINEVMEIDILDINGYSFVGIGGTDEQFAKIEDEVVTFDPRAEGKFEVDLYYNHDSIITTSYYYINGEKIIEDKIEKSYIGDEYTIEVPEINTENFEMVYAYADGISYENVESGDVYTVTVEKPVHNIMYVYKEVPKYTLTIEYDENQGIANEPAMYAEGQVVDLIAIAYDEYEFEKWTYIEQNGAVIEDVNAQNTKITMPADDVVIRANFVKVDTDPIDPVDPVDPVDPIEKPHTKGPGGGSGDKEEVEEIDDKEEDWLQNTHYKPYIVGYEDGTVRPTQESQRIEFVRIIYNLLSNPTIPIDQSSLDMYTDVEYDVWYSEALAFCVNIGVISGYDDNTMKPNSDLTRGEIAVMLVKVMDYMGMEYNTNVQENPFTDVEGHWAEEYINILYSNDIAKGMTDGSFNPNSTTTRAELVAFINRTLNRNAIEFEKDVVFTDLPETHWAYNDMMNAANGFNPYKYEIDHINRKPE